MTTEEPVVPIEGVAERVGDEHAVGENPPAETAKSKKATTKKESKPKKAIVVPRKRNPPYLEMIEDAIVTLKEKTGSSQYAITKFIEEKQKNLPPNFKRLLLVQLKKFVASGKLVKVKGSYKLPSAPKPAASAPVKKKPVPVAKPKASSLKITKEKKPGPSKAYPKPAAKPKPSAKAKPAAKPKAVAAAKPKAAAKTKAVAKPKTEKKPPAKVARTSSRTTPGKKVVAAPKKAAPAAKRTSARSVKPKSVKSPVKKVAVKKGKK
ncbi:histone H1-like [Olea europaea var. sylvestris]|uniref:histone H1-like n=1 Tax=Olea europaea var. sylvestris TaxID=158386 RepID=UPI000C1CEBFE|nr:histone H1-like [Olea europaea var. sylvestris]